jgi:hypothetical protein
MTQEQKHWKAIEDAKWNFDHDYERIAYDWGQMSAKEFKALEEFIRNKHFELAEKFHDAWLGLDDSGGIPVSDDSWSDLLAEVIGRGERFYNEINFEKLLTMAQSDNYHESFLYCLHVNK